jgi:uncharacterized membrane protein
VAAEEDERRSEPTARDDYEVGRFLALSDGVFAIAMTLLVLGLPVPKLIHETDRDLLAALRNLEPNAAAFALSFILVGLYWANHRRFLRGLVRTDGTLLILNLLILLLVCVVPFTAGVLSIHGRLTTAVVLYASNLVLLGLANTALQVHTWHGRLVAGVPGRRRRTEALALSLVGVAVFALSIPIAFLSPTRAEQSWLVLVLIGPARRLGPHLWERLRRR